MYLSNIKLWNFRKYWPANNFESNPNLDLNFEPWLNVLSNIKLWNFRKYWPANNFESNPNLDLNFEPWLNVLIWANDSWKTAILDAMELIS